MNANCVLSTSNVTLDYKRSRSVQANGRHHESVLARYYRSTTSSLELKALPVKIEQIGAVPLVNKGVEKVVSKMRISLAY